MGGNTANRRLPVCATSPLSWSSQEALAFLEEVSLFEEAGILCRIPNWWKAKNLRPRLELTMGTKKPAFLGMDALLDFSADVMIGEIALTMKEVQQLISDAARSRVQILARGILRG